MDFEFFTIMLSNSLKKLRLPDKFAKMLYGHEPRKMKLREAGRRRLLWDMDVVFDADGHMYLGHGWKQFAQAHDLRLGHFLVLSYDGHDVLTVKVFDGSMCRRDYQYDDDATNSSSDSGNTLYGTSGDSGNTLQGAEGEWAEEHNVEQGVSKMSNPCDSDGSQKERSYSSEELSEDSLSADNSVESANLRMLSNNYVVSMQCYLTKAQKVKIDALIEKIKPKFTVLVVQMKKSNIERHTLAIPKDYALKYFPCESTSIKLQLPNKNKAWKCRLHIRPSGVHNPGRRSLYWRLFAVDNHVREGDICLFQPMTNDKHRTFIVIVHLLHKASVESSPGGRSDVGSNHGRRSAKMVLTANVNEEPATDDESVQLNDVQMPSKDYFLSGKCDLTVAQKAKIHEFIAEIQPKIPVFIVLIKKSNIDRRGTLGVSKEYALKYFPCEDTNIILQLPRKNKAWKCRLHIRPSSISNPGRRSLNWGPFACDNDVREGDIFLFQPMTNVKQRRFLVTVHLIHNATRDHSPCGRTDIGTNRGSTSAKMGGVKEEPPINGTKMLQLLGCMCHTSEHEEHEVSEDSERASEPLFILAERASLSPEQNLKCLEKVEEIKFKPPFYVAIMSKSSVCQRGSRCSAKLHFGSQYAATYLVQKFAAGLHREKNSSISLVLQREGKSRSWPTKLQCKYRMGDTCNQMTYLNGWTSFARDNHLRVGDICLFKLMDNEEQLSMMVYIVRR
ncbi:hypothetical protein VPH35_063174 [Triticum aestivum]